MKQRRQLTTSTMHLAQDSKWTYSAVVVQEVLQKQEPRRWGARWPAFRSWQQPTESHHRSWSSYNYSGSSPTTQRRPFYGHLAFKANWKGETAWQVGASRANWKSKKPSFWSVYCLLLFYTTTTNQFLIRLWHAMKSGYMRQTATTSSVAGLRHSEALLKAKLAPKKKVIVTVWWYVASLIHYSFLNPGKIITSEKYARQTSEMHWKLQCLQPALVNRKGPILLQDSTRP